MNIQNYFLVAFSVLIPITASFAGGYNEISGYSEGGYQVLFDDPVAAEMSNIIVYEGVSAFGVDKKREPVPFKQECRLIKNGFVCKKGGNTPLAGAKYILTFDGTPTCPELQAERRYTCVSGCTKNSPRYLKISPWEC